MTSLIEIRVTVDSLEQALERLERGLHNASPMMKEMAFVMNDAVMENFENGGRPKWLGKTTGEASKLQDTGRLKSSIIQLYDPTTAIVGTNLVYAAIHQFGGKTRPHVIRPRNKKALAFNGRVVSKVNHPGSDIPARPFLALTEEDSTELELVAQNYLRNLFE